MHTYRKADHNVWEVGYYHTGEFTQVGPGFDEEFEAAAFANFLNGGRYSPGEIETVFAVQAIEVDDDSIHPDRPKSFDNDYPLERKRG